MIHAEIAQKAAEPCVEVRVEPGLPPVLDALAARSAGRNFLRSAWYGACAAPAAVTLVGCRPDGTPIAAIPTIPTGPALLGARSVPGSYWPFRSPLIAPDATAEELAAMLASPEARAALPLWRIGPAYRDDPALDRIERAAGHAGWTVLTRTLGTTFLFDLGAMRDDAAWPRRSTRRRLANYQKQLAQHGEVRHSFVTGDSWNEDAIETIGRIEANSWVGKRTDGRGAKFLTESHRAQWRRALRDPVIADALSATILYAGGQPVAFAFGLREGTVQYSIASSYDDRFAAYRPGKIVTHRELEEALLRGVRTVDLGAGDGGYKREMGAVAGSEIVDLLIVGNRSAARLLRLKWGAESPIGREAFQATAADRRLPASMYEPLIAAGALAAAALAMAE